MRELILLFVCMAAVPCRGEIVLVKGDGSGDFTRSHPKTLRRRITIQPS
ncbi:MAG: hypothetical protein ACYTEQ_07655 [Planctomycetota bacterium]